MAIVDTDLLNLTNKLQAMSEAAAVAESDLRCTFSWAGQTDIPCVGYPQFEGQTLDVGGWKFDRKVKIKFRFAALPAGVGKPKSNDTVLYRANPEGAETKYKIKSTRNFYDIIGELECEDANS
jgi:hypothetical protein